MKWRVFVERLAERTNPYLADLAIGLAMLVVLMAMAEHFAPQQTFARSSLPTSLPHPRAELGMNYAD